MKPLQDVRIIALEQYGAGPLGTLNLAEMGAEVIKIENPTSHGDIGRGIPPYLAEKDSLYFQSLNRNKKSVALDLQNPASRDVLHDLVRKADAVYSNFRGDGPEKLGIRYEDLKHVNPKIVCCSLSGYGQTGPKRAQPSYDYAIQGLAGWMSVTGEPNGPPTKTGLSVVDWSGGYVAALSLMIGIHAARRDGIGMECDVSLFDVALSYLTYIACWQQTRDYIPERTPMSSHPSVVPFQNFETADGWIVICCATDAFYRKFATALGRGDLAQDERFATMSQRSTLRDLLVPQLAEAMKKRTTAEWIDILETADVPSAPVNSVRQALAEPQAIARESLVTTDHPVFGRITGVRSGVRVGPLNRDIRRAPTLNEHGKEILGGVLGYSPEKLAALYAAGAFGSSDTASSS